MSRWTGSPPGERCGARSSPSASPAARFRTRLIGADSFPRISNPLFPSASRAFDVALPDGRASFSSFVVSMPYLISKLDQGSYPIQSDEQLSRLQRRQYVGRVNPQLVKTHVVKAEIRGRRMQRTKRAVAEQLLQPRSLEDAVRAAERQRRAGDAAYRLAYHVLRPVERGGRFRSRPFLVAEPGRTVCDQPCRFEIGAHLSDVTAYVGVIGERLGIAFRPARTDDPAQLVERGLRDAEIDRGVRAPEPVQIGVAEGSHIVRAEDRSAFR